MQTTSTETAPYGTKGCTNRKKMCN